MVRIIPIENIEDISNKVTEITELSTNEQYPSAKAVYDALQNVEGGGTIDEEHLVGRKTAEGGEIFNDYENNQALVPHSTSKGVANTSGIKGYHFKAASVTRKLAIIEGFYTQEFARNATSIFFGSFVGVKDDAVDGVQDISTYASTACLRTYVKVPHDMKLTFYMLNSDWSYQNKVELDVATTSEGTEYTEVVVPLQNFDTTQTLARIGIGAVESEFNETSFITTEQAIYISPIELWTDTPVNSGTKVAMTTYNENQSDYIQTLTSVAATIVLDDISLDERAYSYYAVDDTIQFNGGMHLHNKYTISSITGDEINDTTIVVVPNYGDTIVNEGFSSGGTDDIEDWVWVVGKSYGIPVLRHQGAEASGISNFVGGYGAHVEGRQNTVIGDYAHGEGRKVIAAGLHTHAEGRDTQAIAESAHAEGKYTIVNGLYAHGEGYKGTASGKASHVENWNNKASGDHSHAGGYNSEASGESSFVHGEQSNAIGKNSFAIGYNNDAIGEKSFVAGSDNTANGVKSFVTGQSNETADTATNSFVAGGSHVTVNGVNAVGSGSWNIVDGNNAAAFGSSNQAQGDNSFVAGSNLVAIKDNQFVVGTKNAYSDSSDALFIVGNGTPGVSGGSSNAFTVHGDGHAELPSLTKDPTAIGDKLTSVTTKGYVDNKIIEAVDNLSEAVIVSDTEPTNSEANIWVQPSQEIVEYAIEVGIKDGWRYKRYNTGFVEYWRRERNEELPLSSDWGTIYDTGDRYGKNIYYPVPFVDIVNAQISLSETDCEIIIGYSGQDDNYKLIQPSPIYGVRATSGVTPHCTINWYACGYIDIEGTIADYSAS